MKIDAQYLERLNAIVSAKHAYPAKRFCGRGIVICAGGMRYFTNAYVAASILRLHNCQLPIQFWHLGDDEMTDEMRQLVKPLDVECVDAHRYREQYPARRLNGWELKPYAIIHSPFSEVISLDADNVAIRNPEFLFDAPQYLEHGAIFWPDYGRLASNRSIWSLVDVEYRDEPEFESGQIFINKEECWKALNIAMHLNEWSDYYYRHIHGDKETFHLAWRKIGQTYAMPTKTVRSLGGCVMIQHDFEGNALFQHRNLRKWSLSGNTPVPGFKLEAECLRFLEELRGKWSISPRTTPKTSEEVRLADWIRMHSKFLYVRVGHDSRPMTLEEGNVIGNGSARNERKWFIGSREGKPIIRIWGDEGIICELVQDHLGCFVGHWIKHEKMPVLLIPMGK